MINRPSLPELERLVAGQHYPAALQMLLNILQAIDNRAGRLDDVAADATYPGSSEEEIALVFSTRFAAAFGRLLTEPGFDLSAVDYERLLSQHRWIDLIFALSGFRTSDNFLSLIAKPAGKGRLTFEGANFLRLLPMLTMNSFIDVDFDHFWRANSAASAVAFFNYISSRYVFSHRAFAFRERLLEWIPPRLAEVKLGGLTLARLPEVYMHCSYAMTPKKHLIKRPLMEQMRRACLEAGAVEAPAPPPAGKDERVTVVVVAEHFTPGHAMFRCYSRAIQSLRRRFNVVGVVFPNPTGNWTAEYFDECIGIPAGDFLSGVRKLAVEISARCPALIFYPAVGMVPQVIALASLRLAPIQCASAGHPATTMSPAIDYMMLREDIIGTPRCFAEKIVALPKTAIPHVRRAFSAVKRATDGKVRVAIPAAVMKLNPLLFDAIARIGGAVKSPVEFQFFPLLATGLPYFELSRIVRRRIPHSTVFPEATYDVYMQRLVQCDLFLCPFPFGNANGNVDCFQLGIPGICLDGEEAHSHCDGAYFARVGLPAELTAKTTNEYVAAAIRLIDDVEWRESCTEIVRRADLDAIFFQGDANLFCKAVEDLIWPPAKQAERAVGLSAAASDGM